MMARYQGRVAVFRASLPQGAQIAEWPSANNYIDEAVLAKLKTLGIPLSPLCSDTDFLRRVTVDIVGRLPTLDETKNFLNDPAADKRARLVDRLLDSPDYAENFALKWNAILRNRRVSPGHQVGSFAFHQWIARALNKQTLRSICARADYRFRKP